MCDTLQCQTILVANTAMKTSPGPTRRAHLFAIVLGLGFCTPLLAEPLPFAGRWLADDPPDALSPYTSLVIKGDTIAWHGADKSTPPCVRQFAVQPERPGTVYTNARGTKFVAGAKGSIPTYVLRLDAADCGGVGSTVRIHYPLIYDTRHIELIDYAGGKPVGARRFHRKE